MPQCVLCREFVPPGFAEWTDDGLAKKCIFCRREKDHVEYEDPDTGQKKFYTKKQLVEDYKKFTKDILDKPDAQKIILKDAFS
jgi:hypothetical protein